MHKQNACCICTMCMFFIGICMFHIMHTSDNKLCANITQYQIEDGDNGMLFLSLIKKNNIALVVGTGESVNSINNDANKII